MSHPTLDELRGSEMTGARTLRHYFEGTEHGIVMVLLDFDGVTVGLRCASVGGISVSRETARYADLQEAGEIRVRDESSRPPFTYSVGSKLVDVRQMGSPADGVIGYRLEFASGHVLYVANWGDDVYVGDQLSQAMIEDGVVELTSERPS